MPMLYHLATDKVSRNIFSYYSSVEKSFCTIKFDEAKDKLIRKNVKTNKEYNKNEFDSILPMFYYRQLLSDGRMPDSIHGIPVPVKQINKTRFFSRNKPTDKNKPHIPLFTLFESMSGRVNLEMPGDVFRLKNEIEFIDPETNTVNIEKSMLFMKAFNKRNFKFPAKLVTGNPSTRKAYDEGYFIIDSKNQIFHLKMVNGKPFLKNTNIPSGIKPQFIATMEPADRSFYAFVFDHANKLYIISTAGYKLNEIPCPEFNINRDQLIIMGNLLYWNVNVVTPKGKSAFALDANTKCVVDSFSYKKEPVKSTFVNHMLPFTVRLESSHSKYIKPAIKPGSYYVLVFNLFFAVLFLSINRYKKNKTRILPIVWIVFTGVFGFIPCIILNKQ
jgi:hypothetical protein